MSQNHHVEPQKKMSVDVIKNNVIKFYEKKRFENI
jgi:hypothetical protein